MNCAQVNMGPMLAPRRSFLASGMYNTALSCPGDPGIGFDFEYSIRMWYMGKSVCGPCLLLHLSDLSCSIQALWNNAPVVRVPRLLKGKILLGVGHDSAQVGLYDSGFKQDIGDHENSGTRSSSKVPPPPPPPPGFPFSSPCLAMTHPVVNSVLVSCLCILGSLC